ncbi:MAG: LuxR C-terminal-related transcriptional regulator [Phycisphaerae bacterium]
MSEAGDLQSDLSQTQCSGDGNGIILVLESDATLVRRYEEFLESISHRILTAESAQELLDLAGLEKADAVIVEPESADDGLALIRSLRELLPHCPIVVVSRDDRPGAIEAAFRMGASEYLTKPVESMEQFGLSLQKAFAAHRKVRELNERIADLQKAVGAKEADLNDTACQLRQANEVLHEKTAALNELLRGVERQREMLAESIGKQIDEVALPLLHRLGRQLAGERANLIDQVSDFLSGLADPYMDKATRALGNLSPTERRLCHLIRRGLTNGEIARMEHVSPQTVSTHRKNIRKKLGLTNKQVNLASYLDGLLG